MALPRPPAGMLRVSIEGFCQASRWANVFWALTTGYDLATPADMGAICTDFLGAFETNFLPYTSNQNHMTTAKGVLYATDHEETAEVNTDHAGTSTSPPAAGANAAVIHWTTSTYWRGGKPRTYIAGLSSGDLGSSTTLDPGVVTGLTSGAAGFLTAVDGFATTNITTVTLGLLSRVSGGVPRTPALFFPFFEGGCRSGIGSQRRRNEYSSA